VDLLVGCQPINRLDYFSVYCVIVARSYDDGFKILNKYHEMLKCLHYVILYEVYKNNIIVIPYYY